ncbi:Exonuclease SbcCD, D subunit [Acidipropionibacterium acidipropionici ATCC 4875]|uniref:Nuclease SbcCD subunit D n=1 Tax=Acidipropionibacterium acidipropionici (strain ATCC 4875 / DSM 20272 / JCM 6432 / NBRC 12425 / NCIMB 8070 / 4) TaxID=1171373 RepID=K7RSJ8_ACIA4|nr:DNA repair exonuclease [Acidipropionibacterium acidipropionici]AFV91039.1 Exonuclease SbcCD, D subunit [Acidipropionibacterium acidipropionici ATCC 4875]
MVRFVHTSDWQLGMTRHYLAARPGAEDDAQARFSADRIEAVRRIGRIAREEHCSFVVVAGDVFETQNVSKRVVALACEAMASIGLPVLLLPGNHDSLEPGCIWDQDLFTDRCPSNVTVLRGTEPVDVADGVQVVGAPLTSRHPSSDPIAPAIADIQPDGTTRILVGHGQLPGLSGQDSEEAEIDATAIQEAVTSGAIGYAALGDRHIRWPEDPHAAIRYCGTHETTRFTDPGRGSVDVVEVSGGEVTATPHEVGRWLHARVSREMATDEDIDAMAAELSGFDDPTRTIVRYDLHGHLSVAQNARLEALLADRQEIFASLEPSAYRHDLVVTPDDGDLDGMDLPGWAASAAAELSEAAASSPTAIDALGLLRRLAMASPPGRAETPAVGEAHSGEAHR